METPATAGDNNQIRDAVLKVLADPNLLQMLNKIPNSMLSSFSPLPPHIPGPSSMKAEPSLPSEAVPLPASQ